MIHGTNSTYVPGGATASEPRYRFMGTGGSMRYYNPADTGDVADTDWEGTTADVSCYTIGAADTFGACDQHTSAVTPGPATRSRPLDY